MNYIGRVKGIYILCAMKIAAETHLPFLLATIAILLTNIVSGARRFERRRGLSDFATNDLLRHARASTSFDESEYPSIESRQLPHRQQIPPRQRALRPVLRQPSATVRPIPNRKRANRFGSSEEEASNFVQEGWPQQTQNKKRDGARYDDNGNRIKHPTSSTKKVPRQNVQHLLIPRQASNQGRPLVKVQRKNYQQYAPQRLARRGQAKPNEKEAHEQRLALLTTPDAGQIASSSQQSFAPQRLPTRERYSQQSERPAYNYKRPLTSYDDQPTQSNDVRRRVDPRPEPVIEEVVPNPYTQNRAGNDYTSREGPNNEQHYQVPSEEYKVSSAPAFGSPSNRRDSYVESPYGYQIPAEQRNLQAAVLSGADAYGRQEHGVYQNEERLSFQIHGHDGPHSYRYGYDTGNGYNRQFRYEERDGKGQLKGRYGFFDKYGDLKVVNYSADPYAGFHAEGAGVPEYPH